VGELGLQFLLHSGHNHRPIRQQDDEEHILDWSFHRVREAEEPERYGLRPKFLSLQRADLYVIECRHEVGSDLSRFLFGYGVGRILFTGLKDVSSVPPITKQLNRQRGSGQQKGDQDCSEMAHGTRSLSSNPRR
jgi:hypothetical protein